MAVVDDLQKTVMIPVLSVMASTAMAGGNNSHRAANGSVPLASPEPFQLDPGTCTQANPLLAAATTLTLLLSQLRVTPAPENFLAFSQALVNSIRDFDHHMMRAGICHETALTARYILCSALDEAILSNRWGIACGWAHRSLLRVFHNEANGGDRFFVLLDRIMQRHADHRDLLELFYLCLALGFAGRFHLDPRGYDKIAALQNRLFHLLYDNTAIEASLSLAAVPPNTAPHDGGAAAPGRPWQAAIAAAGALAIAVFAGLHLYLNTIIAPLIDDYRSLVPDVHRINMDCNHEPSISTTAVDCQ